MSLSLVELDNYDMSLLKELIRLQEETFGELGLNKGTLPLMIRCGRVFLLKRDDEIIGSAELMKDWKDARSAFLVGFSIKAGERRKGMGKLFLQQIINSIKTEVSKIELTTSPQNQAALKLYAQVGFEEAGFWKDAYGAGEDRLLLRLRLAE